MIKGLYHLKGREVKITYRQSDNELDISFDESSSHSLLSSEKLDAQVAVESEIGKLITAVLLPSSRNGTRITLTLVVPEVIWSPRRGGHLDDVTGVAIVTEIYKNVVGGPGPVRQKYETVIPLKGTASTGLP